METLLEIQDRLKDIAKNANITGPVVDSLILMLSESIYRGQVGNVTELLERSFSRCRMLNSAITHSFDRCFSVFRGRNQMFKLVNVVPIASMSVKKFDIAVEASNFKLVYADNYEFESMVPIGDVELLLCESVVTREVKMDTFDLFKADFIYPDISESIIVYRNNLGEYSEHSASRYFGDCVKGVEKEDGSIEFPIWIGTRENYGVSLVSVNESAKFKVNEGVRIKYLKYTNKTINVESIPPISGFISTIVSIDGEEVEDQDSQTNIYNYEDLGGIPRTTSLSEIFSNASAAFLTQSVVKSYNDIESIVKEYYGSMIGSVDIKFDFTTHLDTNNNALPYIFISYTDKTYFDSNITKLEYTLKEGVDTTFLNNGEIVAFKISGFTSDMKKSYYIDEDIIFVRPIERLVPNSDEIQEITGWEKEKINAGKLKIVVYYNGLTAPSIESVIDSYNNTFHEKLNLSRLMADIHEVENVKFAELFVYNTDGEEMEFPLISFEMGIKEVEATHVDDKNNKETTIYVARKELQKTDFEIEYKSFDKYLKSNK